MCSKHTVASSRVKEAFFFVLIACIVKFVVPFGWLRDESPYLWLHCEKRRHHSSNDLGYEGLEKLLHLFLTLDIWITGLVLDLSSLEVNCSSYMWLLCKSLLYMICKRYSVLLCSAGRFGLSFDPQSTSRGSMLLLSVLIKRSTQQVPFGSFTQQVGMVLFPCTVIAKKK
jgi:hypothetical protein